MLVGHGEVLRHLLLEEEDSVLDVEPDHLADRQLGQLLAGQHGEALEDELVRVVLDKIRKNVD